MKAHDIPGLKSAKKEYLEEHGKCELCGGARARIVAFRIAPGSRGWSMGSDNLMALCESCYQAISLQWMKVRRGFRCSR